MQRATRTLAKGVPEVRAVSFVEGNRVRKMTPAQRRAVPSHRAPDSAYTGSEVRRGRNREASVPSVRRGGLAGRAGSPRSIPSPPLPSAPSGALIAEWLIGVVGICIAVPLSGTANGYGKTMTMIMYRLTGLTGIFFVLALAANSSKLGKAAVYFGAIIDLGILYTATSSGQLAKVAKVFNGQPVSGGVEPAADVTSASEPTSQGMLGNVSGTSYTPAPSTNAAVPA